MSAAEYGEWLAYWRIEPTGSEVLGALVESMGKHDKPMSGEAVAAQLREWYRQHGKHG